MFGRILERALLWALTTKFRVPSAVVSLLLRVHIAAKPLPIGFGVLRDDLDADAARRLADGKAMDAAWTAVARATSRGPLSLVRRTA